MSSITEFSLFDEPPNNCNESLNLSKEKQNTDTIISKHLKNTDIFSFNKQNNINSISTTNDKTFPNSIKQKISENVKEVSSFSLSENPRPLNKKRNSLDDIDDLMEIDDIKENDSSMSDSSIKKKF